MINSIDAEKAFDKVQHSIMIKILNEVGIEGTYLNIIKVIYDKPTANIILNGKKLKTVQDQEQCQLSLLLFNIVLEVLARAISQEKRNKRHPNGKGRSKTISICRWHFSIEDPKDFTKKLTELMNEVNKVAGYKINIQKSVAFLYTNNKLSEREIRKTTPFVIALKRIKCLRNKLNQGGKRPVHWKL